MLSGSAAHAVVEFDDGLTGMEHDAAGEVLAELVAQPQQVSSVLAGRRSAGLELDAEQTAPPDIDDDVDLVAAALDPQVVHRHPR